MPDVIDLLSSSPERAPTRISASRTNLDAARPSTVHAPANQPLRLNNNRSGQVKASTVEGREKETSKATKFVKKTARKADPDSDSDGFDWAAFDGSKMPRVALATSAGVNVQKPGPSTSLARKSSLYSSKITPQDDEFEDLHLPSLRSTNREPPSHSSIPISKDTTDKQIQSTSYFKGDAGFAFLSDDFDSTVNLDSSVNQPPVNDFSISGLNRKRMEEERLARVAAARRTSAASLKEANEPRKRKASSPLIPSDDPFRSDDSMPPPKRQFSSTVHNVSKYSGYKRSRSNIETSSKPGTSKSKPSGLARSKSALISDPIIFTSSPDHHAEAAAKRKAKQIVDLGDDDDFIDLENSLDKSWKKGIKSSGVEGSDNNSDSDEFPEIDYLALKSSARDTTKLGKLNNSLAALDEYQRDKKKDREKERKAQEKRQKALDKEAEQERKRIAREEKIYEKGRAAELAKVNTLRTDKKVSTPEMLVDLPMSDGKSLLDNMGKAQGETLAIKAKTFLDTLGVKVYDYQSSKSIIKWRRKVEVVFNDDEARWEPAPLKIKAEKHIMYVMTAKEFVELANGAEGNDLDSHIIQLKSKYESNVIIILIQGLTTWTRSNKNIKNRKFAAAMRSYGPEETTANGRPKKKKPEPEYIDETVVEEALLKLQVMHGMLIHQTNSLQDTAEKIRAFTQHISTIPYKHQQQSLSTTFCMQSGQVKAGATTADTYIRMLQEMVRITPAVAYGIAADFPSVRELVRGFREGGELAVADCKKVANKDGSFHSGCVGQAISRRLYNVFLGRDEWSDNV